MFSRICVSLLAASLSMTETLQTAFAADTERIAPVDRWTLTVTPYGWTTWLDGNQTVRGRSVEIEVDPIQLIEHLESVPFMGYAEARKGPLGFYGDLVYANIGLDADSVRSRGLHPRINGSLSTSIGLDDKQTIAEVGAVYEIVGGQTAIDVLAGARYWHQDASIKLAVDIDLDISDLVVSRGIARARSGSVDWIDPVIGGRIRHQVAPGQELLLRGDIGGFGAGSEFSWNVLAAYSFEICTQNGVIYSGLLGYRALDVEYEQGSGRTEYEYDVLQHGPVSGLTIKY